MRPTMCINVLRPRSLPFKFGRVSISLCYAQISVFCPAPSARFLSSNVVLSCSCRLCTVWWRRSLKSPHKVENVSELQLTSISDQYLLYMCLCTHWFIMVHLGRAFNAVWSTTHWWQTRWRPFFFPFYMGSCTRRLNLLPILYTTFI